MDIRLEPLYLLLVSFWTFYARGVLEPGFSGIWTWICILAKHSVTFDTYNISVSTTLPHQKRGEEPWKLPEIPEIPEIEDDDQEAIELAQPSHWV